MTALDMLDAFIGIIAIYFTLSLIVTAGSEVIVQIWRLHSQILCRLISNMTSHAQCSVMLKHQRIQSLRPKPDDDKEPKATWLYRFREQLCVLYFKLIFDSEHRPRHTNVPSQIPADTFVFVLLDSLLDYRYFELRTNTIKLDAALHNKCEDAMTMANGVYCSHRDNRWRAQVFQYWIQSGQNVEQFEHLLAVWFNDAAERSKGWFKRRLRLWVLLPIGFCLAVFVNANTIDILRLIMENPTVREQQVSLAEKLVESGKIKIESCASENLEKNSFKDCQKNIKDLAIDVIPVVGWSDKTPIYEVVTGKGGGIVQSSITVFGTLIGWFITAVALSLGAPFWFDMLNRLVKARTSVRSVLGMESSKTEVSGAANTSSANKPIELNQGRLPTPEAVTEALDLNSIQSFNSTVIGYNAVNMLWCARLANLAYSNLSVAQSQAAIWGLEVVGFEEGKFGTQAFLFYNINFAVLVFRGTEKNIDDYLTDLNIQNIKSPWYLGRSDLEILDITLHQGFSQAIEDNWNSIKGLFEQTKLFTQEKSIPLWISGHSLGGALAVMAAEKIQCKLEHDQQWAGSLNIAGLYTFGQPRVGSLNYANRLDMVLINRYFRVVNNRDIVPTIPFTTPNFSLNDEITLKLDYEHGGTLIYFNDLGEGVVNPPSWYKALDKMTLNTDDIKAKLKESVSDHSMQNYILLVKELLKA
ncbi:hypothetical protein MAH1_24610 [Sessilibacter sp. MAH1]